LISQQLHDKKWLMKIYTKTGDRGETGLTDGKRVSKRSCTIEAIGSVDELNATLGIAAVEAKTLPDAAHLIQHIQNDCFVLGADLAAPMDGAGNTPRITQAHLTFLENRIDELDQDIPELKHFILPGGSILGAQMHLARAVCRRAERAVVAFEKEDRINSLAKQYLNRLSDLLFTLARWVNGKEGAREEKWHS